MYLFTPTLGIYSLEKWIPQWLICDVGTNSYILHTHIKSMTDSHSLSSLHSWKEYIKRYHNDEILAQEQKVFKIC